MRLLQQLNGDVILLHIDRFQKLIKFIGTAPIHLFVLEQIIKPLETICPSDHLDAIQGSSRPLSLRNCIKL
jgi:hypothetical protein